MPVSEVRPPFFIIGISENSFPSEKRSGTVWSERGDRLGTFSVVRRSGGMLLCRMDDPGAGINGKCVIRIPEEKKGIDLKKVIIEKKLPEEGPPENSETGSFRVSGILFTRIGKGTFITPNPVPASIIPGIDFKRIDAFLLKMAVECGPGCSAGLMSPGEIEKYFDNESEYPMLGKRNDDYLLLFHTGTGVRGNPVSGKILSGLRYKIFIPVKMTRR